GAPGAAVLGELGWGPFPIEVQKLQANLFGRLSSSGTLRSPSLSDHKLSHASGRIKSAAISGRLPPVPSWPRFLFKHALLQVACVLGPRMDDGRWPGVVNILSWMVAQPVIVPCNSHASVVPMTGVYVMPCPDAPSLAH
ncbi:unnamed protein product, partial [Symbiodinium pilosum]